MMMMSRQRHRKKDILQMQATGSLHLPGLASLWKKTTFQSLSSTIQHNVCRRWGTDLHSGLGYLAQDFRATRAA